jgi:hypothetical protein
VNARELLFQRFKDTAKIEAQVLGENAGSFRDEF